MAIYVLLLLCILRQVTLMETFVSLFYDAKIQRKYGICKCIPTNFNNFPALALCCLYIKLYLWGKRVTFVVNYLKYDDTEQKGKITQINVGDKRRGKKTCGESSLFSYLCGKIRQRLDALSLVVRSSFAISSIPERRISLGKAMAQWQTNGACS